MYRTGDVAPHTGSFAWVKYTDGTTTPAPTQEERIIPLSRSETFPPIRSSNKGAIWRDA